MSEPEASGVPAPPRRPDVPAWRQMSTLTVAGAVAGLAIVLVFAWANPRIETHREEVLRAAISEVLAGTERTTTLFVVDGRLTEELPAGADPADLERVFVGFGASGERVGYAIEGQQPGYQDVIRLIFGYDSRTRTLLGMKVLESKETPGLGDKIEKDASFLAEFEGTAVPLVGVKQGAGTGDPREVDMITGATISSRTIVAIINERLERLLPLLEAYERSGS